VERRRPRRLVALAALGLAVIAVVFGVRAADDDGGGTVRAAFRSAVNVVPGQEVRLAGRKVGEVASVEEVDGEAVVELELDEDAWPLRRGTVARLRFDSVSSYAGRFVELEPGPASAPPLADGGILTSSATASAVEFDEIFNVYGRRTRSDLGRLVENAAGVTGGRGDALGRGLDDGSIGLVRLADVVADLGADEHALRTLVRAGARVSGELAVSERALRSLVDRAADTTDELATHAAAQQATLEQFPGALRDGRRMLARLDRSLVGLRGLVGDLGPGARALRAVAPPFDRTTAALFDVAPLATTTLNTGARAAPDIGRLLREGSRFVPELASVLARLAPMFACLRPYAPEISGFLSVWMAAADMAGYDLPYARIMVTQPPPGLDAGTTMTPEQVVDAYRGRIFYAMPRPPGLNAGQPWFIPECGAGRDALDPKSVAAAGREDE
jgi:phospholipid/cholesterol/gamma-HCH transport system substrate-binding protein